LFLDQYLNNAEESKRAAAGWAGDRFAVYEGTKPGEVFFAQLTAWDTETDAKEFLDAYAKRTLKRYPEAKPVTESGSAERQQWQTSSGNVLLERRGLRVIILEGIPSGINANALERLAW
jgi:hypothetical protein